MDPLAVKAQSSAKSTAHDKISSKSAGPDFLKLQLLVEPTSHSLLFSLLDKTGENMGQRSQKAKRSGKPSQLHIRFLMELD